MRSSWHVSWRNLTRHKKRFLFTLIAVILGVAVMTSMLITKYTFANVTKEQEALYAGGADFWIQSNEGYFRESDIAWLKEREEIDEGITSLLKQGFVDMETALLSQRSVRFTGISNLQTDIVELPVKDGDVTKEGAIITENAAKLWGKDVGDEVSFHGLGTLEITAIVYEGPMLNSPETLEEAIYKDFRVMVPLEILQSWTGLEGQISNFRFSVKKGVDRETFLASVQSQLSDSPLFIQPVVVDSQQNNDVKSIYYIFDFIAILAVFISAFIAFNMIHTSIVERKREIGIMKSLGMTRGAIIKFVLQEIGILAMAGTMIGTAIGVVLGNAIQEMLITAVATQNIVYDAVLAEPVMISLVIGFIFPFAASDYPLYKAGKTPILDAILEKDSHRPPRRLGIARVLSGAIFTGIGLIDHVTAFLFLFVGLVLLFPLWMRWLQVILRPFLSLLFGFSGKQAVHSLKQFERRNANTTAMLAIGVSLALFMSAALQALPKGMEDEIRSTFGGSLHLRKETPWEEKDVEFLQKLPGVEDVYPILEVPNVTWYSRDNELREFSIMSFSDMSPRLFDVEEEAENTSDYPAIYAGERALSESGVKVGDIWTLHTPAGEQNFFVKGRVLTSHYSNYVAFAEERVIRETMNWPWSYQVMVEVAGEENVLSVAEGARKQFGSLSGVNTVTETIDKTTSGVTGVDNLFEGLLLLIIGISAIGISNTLFMNTMERVKEIGTMRAIGFTKSQVRFMIISEGLCIGIAGVMAGTLYGILVIYLNSISIGARGLLEFAIPWASLVLAIAGGILFTLLASWLPSHTASKISVKEAIQYE